MTITPRYARSRVVLDQIELLLDVPISINSIHATVIKALTKTSDRKRS